MNLLHVKKHLLYRVFIVFFLVLSTMVGGTIYVIDNQVSNHFSDYLWKAYRHSTMSVDPNNNQISETKRYHGQHSQPPADAPNKLTTDTNTTNTSMTNSMMHGGMFKETAEPPPMGDNENLFIKDLKISIYQWSLCMLIFAIIASYYLSHHIVKPILSLNQVVKDISQGHLDIKVGVDRSDELGQLATSIKVMKESLQHNKISRQAYLAAVAHELRTPLTILQANIEGMQDEVINATPDQMGNLLEEVDRMSSIVNRLKKLTLLEAGQLELQLETVNVNVLLSNIITKLQPLIDEKNLVLKQHIPENLPTIKADIGMIEQCIYNLIMNSMRYTNHGHITISANATADMLIISVADTGIGISETDQPFIFDYFYRADKSRNKKSGGTGLGLAIVKQIVESHHGQVTVESKLGEGSTFTMQLPFIQST